MAAHPPESLHSRPARLACRGDDDAAVKARPPLGLVHYGADGTILDCNQVFLDLLGAPRETVLGANLMHDLPALEVGAAVQQSLSQGQSTLDTQYVSPSDDRVVPIRSLFSAIATDQGITTAGIGIIEDLSERLQIEDRLKLNEERLRLAVDAAHIGIWQLDLVNGAVLWDDWMRRLHGVDAASTPTHVREWRQHLLPADRLRAARAILLAARDDETYTETIRILLPSDEPRYLRFQARRTQTASGQCRYLTGVCYDVTEQHLASARIEQLALFDPLTGLANRRLLIDRLRHALALTQRQCSHRALLLIDLDGFKRINDTRGHAVGDRLLIEFADRLQHAVRRTDTAARLGGDEFVVLCEGLSPQLEDATREAAMIAAKLTEVAAEPYHLAGDDRIYCSASIGITLFADERASTDELMKQSDIAMYQSKHHGRNTWHFFEPGMQRAIEEQEERSQALRRALDEGQLVLRYLPQVDQDGHWRGCEALVRWAASDHELRRPDEFLHLAESSGLIQAIDEWVLTQACRDFAVIKSLEPTPSLHLGVNVSVRKLIDANFADRVLRIVEAAGLEPRHLRLEVTEQALFVNFERAGAAIERLQDSGIAILLDDFGTGSSSLLQLQRLSLQAVKIDQALVQDIDKSPTKIAIVRAAISVARALSLPVIAEGVETPAQFALLRVEGCDLFQGYHFAAPLTLDALTARLAAMRQTGPSRRRGEPDDPRQ